MNQFSERVLRSLGVQSIDTKSKTFFTATANAWLAELFADAVGICMLGPAFYFALCEFLESNAPGYVLNRTHPPALLRRAIAFRNLSRTDLGDHASAFAKHTGVDLTIDTPMDDMFLLTKAQMRRIEPYFRSRMGLREWMTGG